MTLSTQFFTGAIGVSQTKRYLATGQDKRPTAAFDSNIKPHAQTDNTDARKELVRLAPRRAFGQ